MERLRALEFDKADHLMAMIRFFRTDFKEFLKLFNEKRVEYLLIGGYAVGYYGYVRRPLILTFGSLRMLENAERNYDQRSREFGFELRRI